MSGNNPLASWWASRRLVSKHSIVMVLATLTIMPLIYLALGGLMAPTFDAIERRAVVDQNARAKNSLHAFKQGLQKGVGDYAMWDSSYNYLNSPSTAFEKETLGPLTLQAMGVDAIGYVRFDGTVVYTMAADLDKAVAIPAEIENFKSIASSGRFFARAKSGQQYFAYIRTSRGLYAAYTQWISKSDGSGTPGGFIFMANLLDAAKMSEALQAKVNLDLDVDSAIAGQLARDKDLNISKMTGTSISSFIGLQGQEGELLGTIKFVTPRDISAVGYKALIMSSLAIATAIIMLLLILAYGIRRITVSRLTALEHAVHEFAEGRQFEIGSLANGVDEIASLARNFEQMTNDLHAAEAELLQKTYLQGKADSAAGMLHNVRNALAPVRVMQEKWLSEDTLPFRLNMQRAAAELEAENIDPSRKQQLEEFLLGSAKTLSLSSDQRRRELEESKGSIDQIAAILGSYDFDTSGSRAGDEIDFAGIFAKAIDTVQARDGSPIEFDIPGDIPTLSGNLIHLRQVLDNILVNADEAMEASGVETKQIAISWHEGSEPDMIEIRIKDNGDGIAAENIANAFARGYSTRAHKAGGLGLHWTANVMRAMGGSIALESEGIGQGATAVLAVRRHNVAPAIIAMAA